MATILDTPIFTKILGADYYTDSTNTAANYKQDTYPGKKVHLGTNHIYTASTYTNAPSADISGPNFINQPSQIQAAIIKSDYNGNIVLGKTIGNNTGSTYIYQIVIVESGDVSGIYVCGKYTSSNGSTYTNINLPDTSGIQYGFVAKYDLETCTHQLSYAIQSTSAAQVIALSVSSLTTSVFFGAMCRATMTITHTSSVGTVTTIESGVTGRTVYDIRVRGINISTNAIIFSKAFQSTTTANNRIRAISAETDGIYLLYEIDQTLANVFSEKYDYSGTRLWQKNFNTGSANDYGFSMLVNNANNTIYTAGAQSIGFNRFVTTDQDISGIFRNFYNNSRGVGFLIARDLSNGALRWGKQFALLNSQTDSSGAGANEYVTGISVTNKSMYVVGEVESAIAGNVLAEYNGSTLTRLVTYTAGASASSGFILKYDLSGTFQWGRIIDTTNGNSMLDVKSKNNYLALYTSKTANNQLELYNDIAELPIFLTATPSQTVLGTINLSIFNDIGDTCQLIINGDTVNPINITGTSSTYTHSLAISGTNTYTIQRDGSSYTTTATPLLPQITAPQGAYLGTIQLDINAYGAYYDLYHYTEENAEPEKLIDLCNSTVIVDAIDGNYLHYYYIIAYSPANTQITFQSATVFEIPIQPYTTLTQGSNLGTINVTVTNYSAPYDLFRTDTLTSVTTKIANQITESVYIDTVTSRSIHRYYSVITSIINSEIQYTTDTVEIVPRTMAVTGSLTTILGQITLNITNYNSQYTLYRIVNGSQTSVVTTSATTYNDIGAEDSFNYYYIYASVNNVDFSSNLIGIRPYPLELLLTIRNINVYTYTCPIYNNSYSIYDSVNRLINTFTSPTCNLHIHNISVYASSVSAGGKLYKTALINLTDSVMPLVPTFIQPLTNNRMDATIDSTTKKMYITNDSSYVYYCGNYQGTISSRFIAAGAANNTTKVTGLIVKSKTDGTIEKAISLGNESTDTYISQIQVIDGGNFPAIYVCGRYSGQISNISLPSTVGSVYGGFLVTLDFNLNVITSHVVRGSGASSIVAISVNDGLVFIGSHVTAGSLEILNEFGSILYSTTVVDATQQILLHSINPFGQLSGPTPLIISGANTLNDIEYNNGNVYIGYAKNTTTAYDAFLDVYSTADYSLVWNNKVISNNNDSNFCVSVNSSAVFVSGYYGSTLIGGDVSDVLFAGSNVAYVVKRDKLDGSLQWAKRFNVTADEAGLIPIGVVERINSIYATENAIYILGHTPNRSGFLFEWYKDSNGVRTSRRLLSLNMESHAAFFLKYDLDGNLVLATLYDVIYADEQAYSITAKNNYVALNTYSTSASAYYGLYSETEPFTVSVSDGHILGTLDISLNSPVNYTYTLYINNDAGITVSSANTVYTYNYAIDGLNTIYIIALYNSDNIMTKTVQFTPRKPDFSLVNFMKYRVDITSELYNASIYSIYRSDNEVDYIEHAVDLSSTVYKDVVAFNYLYFYKIVAVSPVSGNLFTSLVKNIITDDDSLFNPEFNNVVAGLYPSDITDIRDVIPDKKLVIGRTNIYTIGSYNQAVNVTTPDVSQILIESPATTQGFFMKLSLDGVAIDGISIGNDVGNTYISQIIVVDSGNTSGSYILGRYSSDTGATYSNIGLIDTMQGETASFVAKYDLSASMTDAWRWSIVVRGNATAFSINNQGIFIGGSDFQNVYKVDSNGTTLIDNVFVSGLSVRAYNPITFAMIPKFEKNIQSASLEPIDKSYVRQILTPAEGIYVQYDIYDSLAQILNIRTVKYGYLTGAEVWTKRVQSAGDDLGYSIAWNNALFMSGKQSAAAVTQEADLSGLLLSSVGGAAITVCREMNGSLRWAKQFIVIDSLGTNIGYEIVSYSLVTYGNAVYITGEVRANANMDGYFLRETVAGSGTNRLAFRNTLGTVGFLLKYNLAGEYIYGKIIDGTGNDMILGVDAFNSYVGLYNIQNDTNTQIILFRDLNEAYIDYTILDQTIIIPPRIPCLVAGTAIKIAGGIEKMVEDLEYTDKIVTCDGRLVDIKAIYTTTVKATEVNAPYLIPAGVFGKSWPPRNIILSPKHALQSRRDVWQIPDFAATVYKKIKKTMIGSEVRYYHIELPNYFTDNIIANGCIVESYAGKQVDRSKTLYRYDKTRAGFIRLSTMAGSGSVSKHVK